MGYSMWIGVLVFVVATVTSAEDDQVFRLVKTTSGPVKGYKNKDVGIFQFLSIPYASAPTGEDKFKAPLPAPEWTEPLEATDKGVVCPQANAPVVKDKIIEEDCLHANVYVPDTQKEKLSVVVYVHGGGFQSGYGDWLKPLKLVAEQNVIAVTFNYRLGIHGFLCLGTEAIPGNAGMKDQVAALRWVKANIANFGGNADDVTLAGYSAGSCSADLLMISKAAAGLFAKVIGESGAGINSIQADPLSNAKSYAKRKQFNDTDDIATLEEFFRTLPLDELTKFPNKFSPCIERKDINQNEIFMDESPVDIMKKGNYKKVPLLYGFANMEGLMRMGNFDKIKDKMNENFSDFLPSSLKFENGIVKQEIAKAAKELYFGNRPISDDNILGAVYFFSDLSVYPMLWSVKMQLDRGHREIYLYEYGFVDETTPVVPHTDVRGAGHCAQTSAVFDKKLLLLVPPGSSLPESTDEYKKMSLVVREMWGNFIKTGKPVPEGTSLPSWPPVSEPWSPHMSFTEFLQLRGSVLEPRGEFWQKVYSEHYKAPIPPSG